MTEMACAAGADPELIEAYLLGDLDEPAREKFETHLFECDRCLSHLRLLETLQTELRKEARLSGAGAAAGTRAQWWMWAAAAAAVVVVAGGAALLRRPSPAPQAPPPVAAAPAPTPQAILALATIDPPRYVSLDLRGAEGAPGFAEAMRAYAAGDYAGAAARLRRVRRSGGAADLETDFFFGVSLLMSSDAAADAEAIDPLRRVVSQGDSPYRQLASLYLGKALLRRGDLDGAAAEWERTRALPGTHAREAEDLLQSLRSARGR